MFVDRTLTPDQKNVNDGLVIFTVKDKDFLGMNNQFIGEAFVKFSDIVDSIENINNLPQRHLPLHRPLNLSKNSFII